VLRVKDCFLRKPGSKASKYSHMEIGLDPLLTKSPLPAIVHFFGVIWLLGEAKNRMLLLEVVQSLNNRTMTREFVKFYSLKGF